MQWGPLLVDLGQEALLLSAEGAKAQLPLVLGAPFRDGTGISTVLRAEHFVVVILLRHHLVLLLRSHAVVDYGLVFETRVHDREFHDLLLLATNFRCGCLF